MDGVAVYIIIIIIIIQIYICATTCTLLGSGGSHTGWTGSETYLKMGWALIDGCAWY
jgi:hypothetical protein